MGYLSTDTIKSMGFKSIGQEVRISDKASIYNAADISIGDHSRIDDFCVLSGRISIGRNVHIAVHCSVSGGEPGVELSDFAGLAYGCHVFAQSDDYSGRTLTNPTVPSRFKKEIRKEVHVGRHVIVGAGSVVMPGVRLGDGCSIGAMSLVTRSTDAWFVYAGIPARKLHPRQKDMLELEADYLSDTR